jgi:hypothetical protein
VPSNEYVCTGVRRYSKEPCPGTVRQRMFSSVDYPWQCDTCKGVYSMDYIQAGRLERKQVSSITPMSEAEVTAALITTGRRGKARHPHTAALAALQPGQGFKINDCCAGDRKLCASVRRLNSARQRWGLLDSHLRHHTLSTGQGMTQVWRDKAVTGADILGDPADLTPVRLTR